MIECLVQEFGLSTGGDGDGPGERELAEFVEPDQPPQAIVRQLGVTGGHHQRLFGGRHLGAPTRDIGDGRFPDLVAPLGHLELVLVFLENDLADLDPLRESHSVVKRGRHLQGEVADGDGPVEVRDVPAELRDIAGAPVAETREQGLTEVDAGAPVLARPDHEALIL